MIPVAFQAATYSFPGYNGTMRRAARVDANQGEVVEALRAEGASVESLAPMGKGVPDLLVGLDRRTYLVEVKTLSGKLTADQVRWFKAWSGCEVVVLRSAEDATEWARQTRAGTAGARL